MDLMKPEAPCNTSLLVHCLKRGKNMSIASHTAKILRFEQNLSLSFQISINKSKSKQHVINGHVFLHVVRLNQNFNLQREKFKYNMIIIFAVCKWNKTLHLNVILFPERKTID